MGLETALPNPVGPALSTDRAPQRADPHVAMAELERRAQAGELSPEAGAAVEELKKRLGITPPPAMRAIPQIQGPARLIGVPATGFNTGVGQWVDLFNDGLKAIGLPMNDEPFFGTAFMDKYFAGAQFKPQNMMEEVLHRAGVEVGANVPLLGASLEGRAIGEARKWAAPLAASTNVEALKNLPKAVVDELTHISAAKLAALEQALAAGAGVGAGIVQQVFPEGGRTSEFVGELVGGFTPSVVLGLVRSAKQAVHGVGRAVLGMETEEETKRRLGGKLGESATPEQLAAGVKRAEELRQEISPEAVEKEGLHLPAGTTKSEGLHLSTGSAIKEGSVPATQKAEAKASAKLSASLEDQRKRNLDAVYKYFHETAPDGNPMRTVERLEAERANSDALLKIGLERTQAKVDAVRGTIDRRRAAFLEDMEARLERADLEIDQRLRAIGPQLTPKQRGHVIRQAHQEEIARWREKSTADYHELDLLGDAHLPVSGTITKLADLESEFPAHLQAIRKINPRVAAVIDHLGQDYELVSRVAKAEADLSIVGGKGKDQRGGFRIFEEQTGQGSTPTVKGIPSNYPDWYRSLTTGNNPLDRTTIVTALEAIKTGQAHGLEQKTIDHVKSAILQDREFRTSPFYDPIMDELDRQPSASLKDLRQVRSDLLALGRKARSMNDRTQGYVLHELVGAIDRDIDQLLPGQSVFADRYPEHGALYRQISSDYRQGVETLMKGTMNTIRRVKADGSYSEYDESLPGIFWRNETTMQEFEKAFPNRDLAKVALRDYALEQFLTATGKRDASGRLTIDPSAAHEWMARHSQQLSAFPELEPMFRDTARMQRDVDTLHKEWTSYQAGKAGEARLMEKVAAERRPGDFSHADLAAAEARMNKVTEVVERTKHEWEKSKAAIFLKESPEVAAGRIVLDREPLKAYDTVVAQLKGDKEALAGLNKAIWQNITDAMQPRLHGVTGDMNLGVVHKTIQDMLAGYGGLMKKVLGPEGFKRLETANEAFERIATGNTKTGSDTAINLQVHAALASTWLSRGWAVATGRVPAGFGIAERAMQNLIKTWERQTAAQQEAILMEAFFDPKVFQTLVNAASFGPNSPLVKHQLAQHLHALNLSEQVDRDQP